MPSPDLQRMLAEWASAGEDCSPRPGNTVPLQALSSDRQQEAALSRPKRLQPRASSASVDSASTPAGERPQAMLYCLQPCLVLVVLLQLSQTDHPKVLAQLCAYVC